MKTYHYDIHSQIHASHPSWDGDLTFEIESESDAERRADLIRALFERYGDDLLIVKRSYPEIVPIPIAMDGKATIAAYTYVFHDKSKEDVAEDLTVSTGTIDQYLSDVISGRR